MKFSSHTFKGMNALPISFLLCAPGSADDATSFSNIFRPFTPFTLWIFLILSWTVLSGLKFLKQNDSTHSYRQVILLMDLTKWEQVSPWYFSGCLIGQLVSSSLQKIVCFLNISTNCMKRTEKQFHQHCMLQQQKNVITEKMQI